MPAEIIPPIGPNLLMHFFMNPEEAVSHSVLLQNIPKRKNDKLEPCPTAGSSTGWGIDIVTCVDEFKLFGVACSGTLASVVFGIAWAIFMHDL
ncbi:hypothetical protein HBH89_252560 [Parastagonospora nodorum]|nr:hypothetical protein HBH89_252560 [Parastagonospora nodorum]